MKIVVDCKTEAWIGVDIDILTWRNLRVIGGRIGDNAQNDVATKM